MVRTFTDGPGIVVIERAFADLEVVDRATEVFNALIADQRAAGATAGDHFAKPGANDRGWNALEKMAGRAPEAFADYYANEIIAPGSPARPGPADQIPPPINGGNPGGAAHPAPRHSHLG